MSQWWQPAEWAGKVKGRQWVAAVLLIVGTTAWALRPEWHNVTVQGLDEVMTFKTKEQTLAAALAAQGIELGPKDVVTPPLDSSLKGQPDVMVQVEKAVPVTLVADGKTHELSTTADTVGAMLQEAGITLGPKDGISVDLMAPIAPDMQIKVVRRSEAVVTEQVEIPYETIREEDRSMMAGETKETQEGVAGIREITRTVYYEDGQEVSSEVTEETIVQEPVNQVVAIGTGGVVSRGGVSYRYTSELTLEATGYTAGKESNPDGNGYTYTGMKAVRGVVAVDPNVIPLYTRLYIEGYGPAIAADIGGAIKGYKIDLCFDTVEEALEWGRRPATVYVLSD